MDTFIFASLRAGAGKTSMIVGIADSLDRQIGYIKPFGDRMLYSKKRLWDYDAALMTHLYNMQVTPDEMSIGFDHSKLRYMFDETTVAQRLKELAAGTGANHDVLFVESGLSLPYGTSVHLDALSIARTLDGKLVLIISGDDDTILDDIMFIKRSVDLGGIALAGLIVNKVHNVEDFNMTYLADIKKAGMNVIGVVPHADNLTFFSLQHLADKLFAKVLTAEGYLNRRIKNIFIGAMSANVALQKPLFKKGNKLIITGGDRSDMILAAIETNAAGIVLTNNILPSPQIVAKAEENNIPLLLVTPDTYQIAHQIERLEPLLSAEDIDKRALLGQLARDCIDMKIMTHA